MKTSITANRYFQKLAIIFLWLALWQLLTVIVNQEIILVSPLAVLKTILAHIDEKEFWMTIFSSLIRILKGYTLGLVTGVLFGIIMGQKKLFYDFFYPMLSVIKATPVASFTILALVWLKTDDVPVFISFLMVFPIVMSSISQGFHDVDKHLLEMALIFEFSPMKKYRLIILPSLIPYFISSATLGLGLAWKAGVAAEIISLPKFSIGSALRDSKIYLESTELFAWTAIVIILSVVLEKILALAVRHLSINKNEGKKL